MKYHSLQAGRGLAALAVVLFHTESVLRLDKYLGESVFPPAAAMHYGVNYFFVLSGFIMALLHWENRGDTQSDRSVIKFIARRAYRIYPPLWAALILTLILQSMMGIFSPPLDLALAITAFPISVHESILAVEWTLRHEVLFYALFSIAIWNNRIGLTLVGIWAIAGVSLPVEKEGWFAILVSPYNLLFLIGIATARVYQTNILQHIPISAIFLPGVLLFFTAWYIEIDRNIGGHMTSLIVSYGTGSAMMLAAGVEADRRGVLRIGRPLLFLGDASYSIYLVHFLAVSAGAKVVTIATARYDIAHALAFTLVALFSVLFGTFFYLIVEKVLIGWIASKSFFRPV